jgi:ferrochelatase
VTTTPGLPPSTLADDLARAASPETERETEPLPAPGRDTVALLLMTYGTPGGPDDVGPYLYNIFNDPDIIELPWYMKPFRGALAKKISDARTAEVIHNYSRLGGRSPLLEYTEAQGEALVAALRKDGDFRSFMGMRYWTPRTPDALREILDLGIRKILLVPMYPQYARATTGSSITDFRQAARRLGARNLEVRAICAFPDNAGMVSAMAGAILKEWETIPPAERAGTPLLFSAHGLPQSVVDKGDPYQSQVEKTVAAVVKKMGGHDNVTICYQSRVGKQVWLQPYTDEVIDGLIKKKVKRIVLYPVAFVTEHSETLFELDLLYGDLVRAAGIEYRRIPAVGTDPLFIEGLADEVRAAMAGPLLSLG